MNEKTKDKIKLINTDNPDFELEYPLYFDCYLRALRSIVNKITDEMGGRSNRDEYSVFYTYRECDNIIAFVGDRGTGKTTALKEFCKILENSNRQEKERWLSEMKSSFPKQQLLLESDVNFCVLPLIDASLLDDKEDIFELILAAMFEKYEKERSRSYSYNTMYPQDSITNRRKVAEEFGKVYRNYYNVRQKKEYDDVEESVISKLRAFSSSMKTQEAFSCLLRSFFANEDGRANFLVIVIDDLDLNLSHGFEMLEQIHKYFFHSQVIVLTTFSYEQLLMITENHFRENLRSVYDAEQKSKLVSYCHQLAVDHLDKIIPVEKRIYMPKLKKLSNKFQIRENDIQSTVKKFLMRKIADRVGVFYDGIGIKAHFIEKSTVRALTAYNDFLDAQEIIDFSDCVMIKGEKIELTDEQRITQNRVMRQYMQNQEWFNRDIHERMIYDKLSEEQREFFEKIQNVDLRRRASYTVLFQKNRAKGERLDANIENEEYRYGNLLECIYRWGRDFYDDKKLIHCILASFTSEMTREYFNYMYNCKDIESGRESKEILKNFIGKSFGNSWTREILPIKWMVMGDGQKEEWVDNIGIVENLELKFGEPEFLFEIPEKNISVEDLVNGVKTCGVVPILECFNMLVGNCIMNGQSRQHLSLTFHIDRKDKKMILKTEFCTDMADFDIFGFVVKSLEPISVQRAFSKSLISGLSECLCKDVVCPSNTLTSEEKDEIKEELKKQLEHLSIFYGQEENCKEVAFPFYDLDISYNVIKRVRKKSKEMFIQPITFKKISEEIKKVYEGVEEELEKQKVFYCGDNNEEKDRYRYDTIFKNYPFIKAMEDTRYSERCSEVIGNIIKAGTPFKRSREEIDE